MLINRLIDKGFCEKELYNLPRNMLFFNKGIINVLVIQYSSLDSLSAVNEDVLESRNHLASIPDINIWNTYALIIIEDSVGFETTYILEKDSSSIRKFVLQSEEDFSRIFFLDTDELNDFIPMSISKTKSEENITLKELYKFIKEKGGETQKLKNKDVKEGIELLISLVGEKNEYF